MNKRICQITIQLLKDFILVPWCKDVLGIRSRSSLAALSRSGLITLSLSVHVQMAGIHSLCPEVDYRVISRTAFDHRDFTSSILIRCDWKLHTREV